MKKNLSSGFKSTTKNNSQESEKFSNNPDYDLNDVKNKVLIELNFQNDDYEFVRTFQMVFTTKKLRKQIGNVVEETGDLEYLIETVYADARYHAVNSFVKYDEMSFCFRYLICCLDEVQYAIKKQREGGFKVVINIDLVTTQYPEVIVVPFQNITKSDIHKFQILNERETAMTLESKMNFLTREEVEIFRNILLTLSSKRRNSSFSKQYLRKNMNLDDDKDFNRLYTKLIELKLLKLSKKSSNESRTILKINDNTLFNHFNIERINI